MNEATDTISIEGVVIPDCWAKDYRVTSVVLACEGERDIAFANLAEFPELLSMSRKRIRISGTLTTSRRNGKTLEVMKVHRLWPLENHNEPNKD